MMRKNLIRKVMAFIFATCILTSITACGPKKVANTYDVIELSYWTSGLGEEYIKKTIANFEKKYPQYKVAYEPSANGAAITNTFGYGANYDTVDLYMYAINSLQPKDLMQYAEPLDELVASKYEDEELTLEEKIMPNFRSAFKSDDGHYHSLTYGGGWTGIAYNRKIIDGVKYKVPNTTDELARLALDISDDLGIKGIAPFIHYQNGGYWMTVANTWQIQYDGVDYYYNRFLPLKDANGNSPSKEMLTAEDGRKATMDVMEKLITPGNVYNGSNALIFTDAQTLFLNDRATMMVNGSWMVNEMKQHIDQNYDFSMMPTPIISSIRNKCTTIENDAELSALVTAIDNADSLENVPLSGTGYSVNEADRAKIYEARYIMYSNFDQHGMIIPTYASAKEAAKLFVQYFYSDENLKMYHDVTHMTLPIRYSDGSAIDQSSWMAWEKQQQYFTENCLTFFDSSSKTSKIFTSGGCTFYAGIDFISSFCNQNKNARISSDQAWSQMLSIFNNNWELYKNNAQL